MFERDKYGRRIEDVVHSHNRNENKKVSWKKTEQKEKDLRR